MDSSSFRASIGRHKNKAFLVSAVFIVLWVLVSESLPRWVSVVGFLLLAVFVLIPMSLGIGPLGRRFGRELNEAAVAEDRKRRASLGSLPARYRTGTKAADEPVPGHEHTQSTTYEENKGQ